MAVIFIFTDGVGIGHRQPENPFYQNSYESFQILSGENYFKEYEPLLKPGHLFKGIDANLHIEGLPQSGTGQATLFSGHNASEIIGKHFGPFPHSKTRFLLREKSLFNDALKLGKKPYFANAYPPIFFEMSEKRNRWSCTTLMTKSSGIRLNTTKDILEERALTAEIIQNAWREKLGINIPEITEEIAAQRLLDLAAEYDLVLFEYYLTDKAGHSQQTDNAARVLRQLDAFLSYLIKHKLHSDTLVITSDHGNIEDLSTKTHTRNEVPLFVLGNGAAGYENVSDLTGVKGAVLDNLKNV